MLGRKKESSLLLIVLVLSFLLSSALAIILPSTQAEAQLQREKTYGSWQVMLLDRSAKDCQTLAELLREQGVQCAVLPAAHDSSDEIISVMTPEVMALGSFELLDGRLPETENEILIVEDQFALGNLPKVGDSITVRYIWNATSSIGNVFQHRQTALLEEIKAAAFEACKAEYLDTLTPGDILPCTVTHIEPFGAFCDVGCGISALLPIDCMSVSRISSPADRVSVGQQILCAIKSRDVQGRFVLTIRELLGTWAENAAAFTVGETVVGIVRSVEEYGTFIEIAPNLAGLAESCPDLHPGQPVSVYIKNILPDKMKIKLVIVNHSLSQSHRFELRYFITEGHLDHWLYSTPESHKRIETDFAVAACNPA